MNFPIVVTLISLIVAFVLVGLSDIGLNLVGLIPFIGDVFDQVSNAVHELLQLIVYALTIVVLGGVKLLMGDDE